MFPHKGFFWGPSYFLSNTYYNCSWTQTKYHLGILLCNASVNFKKKLKILTNGSVKLCFVPYIFHSFKGKSSMWEHVSWSTFPHSKNYDTFFCNECKQMHLVMSYLYMLRILANSNLHNFPCGVEIQLTYLSNLWETVLYVTVKALMVMLSIKILYLWEY